MSRAYDMYLQVAQFQPERREMIKAAAQEIWDFEWFCDSPTLEGFGESSLCGGEMEDQFAKRLANDIWAANGGFCSVIVTATYLDDLPKETYEFDEEAFKRFQAADPGEESNDATV
jgi:hypothetical protein